MAGVQRNLVVRAGVDISNFQKGMKNMQKTLERRAKKIGDIASKMAKSFTLPVLGMVAITTKGMEEIRGDLAKLETNANLTGQSIDGLSKHMEYLNAVTGETDSNVEALSNVMAAGFKGNDLSKVIDSLAGAVIKFPDTLKIEGLADGLQETLATGKAIGPFAELLDRTGINLENFNEGLARATSRGQQNNYILQTLAKTGLSEVNAKYKENNKELIDNSKAQYQLQMQLAKLGETFLPLLTQLVDLSQSLVGWFNNLSTTQQKWIIGLSMAAIAVNGLLVVYQKLILLKATIVGLYKGAAIAQATYTLSTNANTTATATNTVAKKAGILTMLKSIAIYAAHTAANIAEVTAVGALTIAKWGLVAATWALNAAMAVNPFVWIAIGVGALITAIVLLWKKSEGFRNFFIKMWDGIKAVFSAYVDFFVKGVNLYLKAIKYMINAAISLLNSAIKGLNKIPGFDMKVIPKLDSSAMQIPEFANGGIVYGKTLGVMGEYANAKTNPEVIAPLDKLESLIGGGNITLVNQMDSDVISRVVFDRAGRMLKSYG